MWSEQRRMQPKLEREYGDKHREPYRCRDNTGHHWHRPEQPSEGYLNCDADNEQPCQRQREQRCHNPQNVGLSKLLENRSDYQGDSGRAYYDTVDSIGCAKFFASLWHSSPVSKKSQTRHLNAIAIDGHTACRKVRVDVVRVTHKLAACATSDGRLFSRHAPPQQEHRLRLACCRRRNSLGPSRSD